MRAAQLGVHPGYIPAQVSAGWHCSGLLHNAMPPAHHRGFRVSQSFYNWGCKIGAMPLETCFKLRQLCQTQ